MWSIPEEIHFLSELIGLPCQSFRHQIVAAKIASPDDDTPTSLLSYNVPENFTWIVTLTSLRSIPEPDDPALTVGDWRSTDYDASGTAKAYYQINGTSATSEDATYFAIFNHPCLLAFQAGVTVDLIIERFAGAVPADENIVIAINSYLAPARAYDCLANNLTQIEATYT